MPVLYLDHNVPRQADGLLRQNGHAVWTSRQIHRERATDDEQLLVAVTQGWTIVTNNARDFVLLHDAWHRWSQAWHVTPRHSGILITRQTWDGHRVAAEVSMFLALDVDTANELYQWHGDLGWVRRPRASRSGGQGLDPPRHR
ncbi:MAG: DUF5615 family PIN-like protein [Chloroflexi bacterium]|nr:DUF5615 family PIN-like protein [Chloroflexota bacterium]